MKKSKKLTPIDLQREQSLLISKLLGKKPTPQQENILNRIINLEYMLTMIEEGHELETIYTPFINK